MDSEIIDLPLLIAKDHYLLDSFQALKIDLWSLLSVYFNAQVEVHGD